MEKAEEIFKKLMEAKKNVLFCLNNADGLAGMHGLEYWAGEVERLRKEIKKEI